MNGVPGGATLTSGHVGRCCPLVNISVSEALMLPGNCCSTPISASCTIGSRKSGVIPRAASPDGESELGLMFSDVGTTAPAKGAWSGGPGALKMTFGNSGAHDVAADEDVGLLGWV